MKTKDKSFSGFPGCWNMFVLVMFATEPNFWAIFVMVVILSICMFIPLRFIHPVRTVRWRSISLPVSLMWTVFAAICACTDFEAGVFVTMGLTLTSIYLLGVGIVQQLIPEHA